MRPQRARQMFRLAHWNSFIFPRNVAPPLAVSVSLRHWSESSTPRPDVLHSLHLQTGLPLPKNTQVDSWPGFICVFRIPNRKHKPAFRRRALEELGQLIIRVAHLCSKPPAFAFNPAAVERNSRSLQKKQIWGWGRTGTLYVTHLGWRFLCWPYESDFNWYW